MAIEKDLTLDEAVETLSALLAQHESAEHGGDPCPVERMNMLAWVAHRLGWRPRGDADLHRLGQRIEEFWQQCPHMPGNGHLN